MARLPHLLTACLGLCLAATACASDLSSSDQAGTSKTTASAAAASPETLPASPAVAGPVGESCPPRYLPELPKQISLAGELVPLGDPLTAEALDREFTIAVHDQAQVVMWMKRARRYFPYITQRLKAAGLPDDLKYLAVAESSLLHRVVSPVGATGPWQFMDSTGKAYGLRHDAYFDDRRNPELATDAALALLRDLRKSLGSWALAMAAYNCGERRVRQEMAEQGVGNYYDLYLPYETMRYIPRIIAAKLILENPSAYGYCLPPDALYKPLPADRVRLSLANNLHLRTLAQATHSTVKMLKELNPELTTYLVPKGTHDLKVPAGQGPGLAQRLAQTKLEPTPASAQEAAQEQAASPVAKGVLAKGQAKHDWTVKGGESLSGIAQHLGVSVASLRRANSLSGDRIKPGQKLIVPVK